MSISTFRDDGWLDNTAALVRVTDGPAQVLVTIYQAAGQPAENAPRLQVLRLAGDSAEAPAEQGTPARNDRDAEVMAHIQGAGDVPGHPVSGSASVAAGPGSKVLVFPTKARSPRATLSIKGCLAAAGCRPGSRTASSAAAAAWRCPFWA